MRFPATPGRGPVVSVVGGDLPLLAEGLECDFPPLLAGASWLWWCVVPCHSWLRAPGAVPCHFWLGSAGGGGGRSLATPG